MGGARAPDRHQPDLRGRPGDPVLAAVGLRRSDRRVRGCHGVSAAAAGTGGVLHERVQRPRRAGAAGQRAALCAGRGASGRADHPADRRRRGAGRRAAAPG